MNEHFEQEKFKAQDRRQDFEKKNVLRPVGETEIWKI